MSDKVLIFSHLSDVPDSPPPTRTDHGMAGRLRQQAMCSCRFKALGLAGHRFQDLSDTAVQWEAFLDDSWRSHTVFACSSGILPSPIQASTGLSDRLAPDKNRHES